MLFFGLNSLAQGLVIDTILPNTSFISTVDSIEDFTQSSRSVFPAIGLQGGIFIDPLSVYQPMGQLINPGLLSEQPIRFTALPLLGFAYAFGTQGSQHMKFSYAQAFKYGLLLNVNYKGHGANGYYATTHGNSEIIGLILQKFLSDIRLNCRWKDWLTIGNMLEGFKWIPLL